MDDQINLTQTKGYSVRIFIAGDLDIIKQTCRDYCYQIGLCVTVTPTSYIYTGGEESGAIIELINYARFPKETTTIWNQAIELGQEIMIKACQTSYTVQDNEYSQWFSRRKD